MKLPCSLTALVCRYRRVGKECLSTAGCLRGAGRSLLQPSSVLWGTAAPVKAVTDSPNRKLQFPGEKECVIL